MTADGAMMEEARPEFSFVVHPSVIAPGGDRAVYELEANGAQREALAHRFGFLDIEFFRATISLRRVRGGDGLRLQGHILARVVQSCVVTLEPVISDVDKQFELLLLDDAAYDGETVDPEADVDLYSGDSVDIAEIAAEELALALDPYPRSPEAAAGTLGPGGIPPESEEQGDGKGTGYRPFEALAGLKRSK
jgi:uncharacterized metal-binding protein YceD (DUF177 family)